MDKNVREVAKEAATLAVGVAAAWYLVHQVWRAAVYVGTSRYYGHRMSIRHYLQLDD